MFKYTVFAIDTSNESGDGEVVLLTAQTGGQDRLPAEQVILPAEMAGDLARAAGGLAAGVTRCEVTHDGHPVGEFRFYRGWKSTRRDGWED